MFSHLVKISKTTSKMKSRDKELDKELEVMLRKRRDLASRVPSISIEEQRKRIELDRLGDRVDSVLSLESRLADLSSRFDEGEVKGSRGILGSMVQSLVLVRNTKLQPVLITKWAEELEMVLEEETEETLTDLLLWTTVLHWWHQTLEGSNMKTCAELVYSFRPVQLQKTYLAEFLRKSSWTKHVRGVMEEAGWAGPEVWKKMDRALADGGDEHHGVSMNLPLLENLFLMEEIGVDHGDI